MGYSTEFTGRLKFKNEITGKQLAKLKTILGEDCRDHPEWNETGLSYIDLEISDDFEGLEWSGSEKTSNLVEKTNLVIKLMKEDFPEFALEGTLLAQGEESNDKWSLVMVDNVATEVKFKPDYSKLNSEVKCWLVVEDGYEYNDEYYNQPDCEGYEIKESKLFTEKEAQELVDKLNGEVDEYFTTDDEELIQPFRKIKLEI